MEQIAVAVVLDGDRVLIGKRPDHVPWGGFWEFPGGKILPGEKSAEAASRECREETGVAICVERLLYHAEAAQPDGAAIAIDFWLAKPQGGFAEPKPPFCWVPCRQLRDYRFPPANDGVLRLLGVV